MLRNLAVVDRMGRHQLNWHIRKPQYGSRRLAAKNHFVAALGEVSPHEADRGDSVLAPSLRFADVAILCSQYVGTTLFMLFALGATK